MRALQKEDQRLALYAVVLAICALALRLGLVPLAEGRSLSADPASYVNIAHNVLAGKGIVRHSHVTAGDLRAYYPPVYPVLLASVGSLAPLTPPTFATIHWLIDLLTAVSMLWLARALGLARGVGTVAGAIYLLWPTNILSAPVPQKEGLETLLTVIMLAALFDGRAIVFGLVSGILALTQPGLATLSAIAAICCARKRDWFKFVLTSLAAAIAVMIPWWARNYIVFGTFIPLTTASGMSFWVGTMGDGIAYQPGVEKFIALPEIRRSSAAFHDAFDFIAHHPWHYMLHTLSKATSVFLGDRWATMPLHWLKPILRGGFFPANATQVASIALYVFGIIGVFSLSSEALKRALTASVIQLFAVLIWFQFSERHRYFMVPLLMLAAVAGLREIAISLKAKQRGLEERPAQPSA